MAISEFKASPIYRMGSRTARTVKPCLKETKPKTDKQTKQNTHPQKQKQKQTKNQKTTGFADDYSQPSLFHEE